MKTISRRNFIKSSSLSAIPIVVPFVQNPQNSKFSKPGIENTINFFFDGVFRNPEEYVEKLSEISKDQKINGDFYGNGGDVNALEEKFAEITGKEKAIYMPSGTMANQLAIRVLSGNKTKVFVQENSHIYRDEADAAQSIHQKRLVPFAKDTTKVTLENLKSSIDYHNDGEVFKSGIGAISIENPIRRSDGQVVDIDEIRKIAEYAKSNGFGLHLDGARLHIAAAFSGISVREYVSYFDTVYISLYKYLGAAGGAILCGDAEVINKMPHLIKILGGTCFQNWPNATMALHNLEGIENRLIETVKKWKDLQRKLKAVSEFTINEIPNGSNIFNLKLESGIDIHKFTEFLQKEHQILVSGRATKEGMLQLQINETLLNQDNDSVFNAFGNAVLAGKS